MKITVLVDNNASMDSRCLGEHGLSIYIEEADKKILFDVGGSDLFRKNASKLGIRLSSIDYLILSHGHYDHTLGLAQLTRYTFDNGEKPILLAHPFALCPKERAGEQLGFIYSTKVMENCFDVQLSKEPVWITDKLVFLGEIKRTNSFENQNPIGTTYVDGVERPDYILDDTALAYKTDKGLVIITGCSHAGICNIIEYAKNVCCDSRVFDVVGGLHLKGPTEEQMNGTLEYFSNLGTTAFHACHCTDLPSKILLSKVVNLKEIGAGTRLIFES